jgi:hypothetical protein
VLDNAPEHPPVTEILSKRIKSRLLAHQHDATSPANGPRSNCYI